MSAATLLIILASGSPVLAQADSVAARLEQAASLISNNQTREAEQAVMGVLKVAPNEPAALNLLGTIRAKQGRISEAKLLFLRAVRGDSRYVGARMNLAYVYTLMGQPQKSISELKGVLLVDPKNPEALDQLARLLMAQERIDEGIEAIEQAGRHQTVSDSLLVLLGDAYLKQGNAAKAEETYQRALAQQSEEDTDAVLGLAQVAQYRSDATAASAFIERARKMEAHSPDTLYRFALVAMRAGLYEEANGTLLAAIQQKPDEAAFYLALGNTWIKKPDLVEAEKAFRRAVQLQPDNSQAQMNLGYTLLEQKKYPEAREWLQKSLAKDKTVPETYFYLGRIAQEFNEDAQAIVLFKKAIELAPTYSFAHASLGASYLRLKSYPEAQRELELSIKLNPNDAKAHYDLAVLFARLKNRERSQQEMQIVEKLKAAARSGKAETNTTNPDPR